MEVFLDNMQKHAETIRNLWLLNLLILSNSIVKGGVYQIVRTWPLAHPLFLPVKLQLTR